MSSQKYVAPLQLDLFASRSLLVNIAFIHALAFGALFYLELPLEVLVLLGLVIFYNAAHAIYKHAMRSSGQAITRVIWEDSGRWYIVRRNGEKKRVQLLGDTFIHPQLTVLNFRIPNKWFSQSVILASDNVNKDSHRRLRMRLRTSPEELME